MENTVLTIYGAYVMMTSLICSVVISHLFQSPRYFGGTALGCGIIMLVIMIFKFVDVVVGKE